MRTSGLPNIGIQGVCFGHVVAAMSPRSEPFNWGNVLWHELGHVFAIQLSKNHVPRWFTEGLSEYETMIRRPEWQRELDPELCTGAQEEPAARRRRHEPRRSRTRSGDLDVTVAYYAASQMVAFTAEQFGFDAITRALELWGQGKRTPDVLREAFGVTPQEYDAQLPRVAAGAARAVRGAVHVSTSSRRRSTRRRRRSTGARQSVAAHVGTGPRAAARAQARRRGREIEAALSLDPTTEGRALHSSAKLAEAGQGPRRAGEAPARDQAGRRRRLRGGAGARRDRREAPRPPPRCAPRSSRRTASIPTQADAVRGLFDLATEEKRDGDALAALREVARLDQHDRRAWRCSCKLVAAKQWDEAKRIGESAVYVDVESAAIHVDYARALAATGDHETAAFELESALLCDAKPPEKAEMHALLARERQALGDAAGARTHRDEALELDPNNADARALKL